MLYGFAAEPDTWTNRPPGLAGRFFFAFAAVSR